MSLASVHIICAGLFLTAQLLVISPQIVFPEHDSSGGDQSYCENSCRNGTQPRCNCDRHCALQKDCCVDSPYRGRSKTRTKFACLPPEDTDGVYMVTNCKRRWRGSRGVITNCTRLSDFSSDPLGQIPVTNVRTRTTYKNHYCAMCNGDTRVVPWKIAVLCGLSPGRVSESYVRENIVYNTKTRGWGIWLTNSGNVPAFYACHVEFRVPELLQDTVRRCYGENVSSCASDWTDVSVQRKCDDYLDPVLVGGVVYRNFHCTECNRVPASQVVCLRILARKKPQAGPGANFAMLMDFGGEGCVGDGGNCSCDQTWDPFFKKCRNKVSLPFR